MAQGLKDPAQPLRDFGGQTLQRSSPDIDGYLNCNVFRCKSALSLACQHPPTESHLAAKTKNVEGGIGYLAPNAKNSSLCASCAILYQTDAIVVTFGDLYKLFSDLQGPDTVTALPPFTTRDVAAARGGKGLTPSVSTLEEKYLLLYLAVCSFQRLPGVVCGRAGGLSRRPAREARYFQTQVGVTGHVVHAVSVSVLKHPGCLCHGKREHAHDGPDPANHHAEPFAVAGRPAHEIDADVGAPERDAGGARLSDDAAGYTGPGDERAESICGGAAAGCRCNRSRGHHGGCVVGAVRAGARRVQLHWLRGAAETVQSSWT
eukprot:264652-Rhodomonas_salina.2